MTTVKDFEERVKALELELAVAKATLHSARMVVAGISPGDIVQGIGKFAGQRIRIVGVDSFWGNDKPWINGNVTKADGSFGTAVRNIYSDWTK